MTPTKLDIRALRILVTFGGTLDERTETSKSIHRNTWTRLLKMGFAQVHGAFSYAITDDGRRFLDGLDGKGPTHWRLVINHRPACVHGDIGAFYGCASSRRSEVERWADVVRQSAPGALVEILDGDCQHEAP